jgi:ribosome-associated protein
LIKVNQSFHINNEVELIAIRAQGSGQNVNKVSSAIHLRFDVGESSLPDFYKAQLFKIKDQRISKEGVIIKAQKFRTQEKNRLDAFSRLQELVRDAIAVPKSRRPTRPSNSAKKSAWIVKHSEGVYMIAAE